MHCPLSYSESVPCSSCLLCQAIAMYQSVIIERWISILVADTMGAQVGAGEQVRLLAAVASCLGFVGLANMSSGASCSLATQDPGGGFCSPVPGQRCTVRPGGGGLPLTCHDAAAAGVPSSKSWPGVRQLIRPFRSTNHSSCRARTSRESQPGCTVWVTPAWWFLFSHTIAHQLCLIR